MKRAYLILANGQIFKGFSVGAEGKTVGEIVFNTGVVGYTEMITDPSYSGCLLNLTYPIIGNVGVNDEDRESKNVYVNGVIMRQMCKTPSNWRTTQTLEEFLVENNVIAISDIDTREVTKVIRKNGQMNAMITTDENAENDLDTILGEINAFKRENSMDKVIQSKKHIAGSGKSVAVIDLGIKNSVLSALTGRNLDITLYPANTCAEEILKGNHDGILVSNGSCDIETIKTLAKNVEILTQSSLAMLGIDLGHNLIAEAMGLENRTMPFGHNGCNQPVNDIKCGKTFITIQTHCIVVERDSIKEDVATITHDNNNDFTVEGLSYANGRITSVNFLPDTVTGQDTAYIYDEFVSRMGGTK